MEVKLALNFQPCMWTDSTKMNVHNGFTRVSQRTKVKESSQTFLVLRSDSRTSARRKSLLVEVSSSLNNSPGSVKDSGGLLPSLDESLVLKRMSHNVEPYLSGRCLYLVGMMGSGKTTIGKTLSDVLGYNFSDCDELIEQTVDGMSVTEIFKQHGEEFYRDRETEVLKKLSTMHRLVVSTGGGAVIRPINWKHMRQGISVWLDVPLECLARRISAVGTNSRPLLHGESGDEYSKVLTRLSMLLEDRAEAYANASTRVSLESYTDISAKLGHLEVDDLTPTVIAIEVLEQIESFLKANDLIV